MALVEDSLPGVSKGKKTEICKRIVVNMSSSGLNMTCRVRAGALP